MDVRTCSRCGGGGAGGTSLGGPSLPFSLSLSHLSLSQLKMALIGSAPSRLPPLPLAWGVGHVQVGVAGDWPVVQVGWGWACDLRVTFPLASGQGSSAFLGLLISALRWWMSGLRHLVDKEVSSPIRENLSYK